MIISIFYQKVISITFEILKTFMMILLTYFNVLNQMLFFLKKNFEVVPRPKLKMQLLEFSIRYIFNFSCCQELNLLPNN